MRDLTLPHPLPLPETLEIQDLRAAFAARLVKLASTENLFLPPQLLWMADTPDDHNTRALADACPPCSLERRLNAKTLIVPGLLADSVAKLVAPFMNASAELLLDGYQLEIAWVNGRRGCEHNARVLRDKVLEVSHHHGDALHIVGYSKGCTDTMHMLAAYPETHACIKAFTAYSGVVSGTPLADNTSLWVRKLLQYMPIPGVAWGDGRAVHDLMRTYRQAWLARNELPDSVKYFSVVAAAQRSAVSRILRGSYDRLAEFDPMNDSQVIWKDGILPKSDLLAVVNADHWAVTLPLVASGAGLTKLLLHRNAFPRELVLRAVLDHVMDST